jgi:hypothetical protein
MLIQLLEHFVKGLRRRLTKNFNEFIVNEVHGGKSADDCRKYCPRSNYPVLERTYSMCVLLSYSKKITSQSALMEHSDLDKWG